MKRHDMNNAEKEIQDKIIRNSFIDKLVDWQEFEHFVQKLYEDDPNLIVEHNVTTVGKSGAKRQIDVLIKQKSKFMTVTVLVECKRWKENVSRAIIDVVASAMEDLNANKGVVFTTSGYEEGAIQYAKYKNIDIFVVRDLLDEEWGRPGRNIQFWMQFIGSKITKMNMPNVAFRPFAPGLSPALNIDLYADVENEKFILYSNDNQKGLYLGSLVLKLQEKIQNSIGDKVPLLSVDAEQNGMLYSSNVKINFENYAFRYMHFPEGIAEIKELDIEMLTHITQSNFKFDRGEKVDFILMVENYIANQKHRVIKMKDKQEFNITDNLALSVTHNDNDKDILQNGSIMKAYMKTSVNIDLSGSEVQGKTNTIMIELDKVDLCCL